MIMAYANWKVHTLILVNVLTLLMILVLFVLSNDISTAF